MLCKLYGGFAWLNRHLEIGYETIDMILLVWYRRIRLKTSLIVNRHTFYSHCLTRPGVTHYLVRIRHVARTLGLWVQRKCLHVLHFRLQFFSRMRISKRLVRDCV